MEVKGGFNTPEEVVQAFGGRATGYVEGVVFHDRNRDGVRNLDEPPLLGARVRVGALEAQSDAGGRYRLELYPGVYRLEVGGLEANLALRRVVEARVEKGKTLPLDLPMETVVGLQGQVYLDENRNGQRDEGEAIVPYARIRLQGPEVRTALADGRGSFVVGGLLPGRYTLSLDQEPGAPAGAWGTPGPGPGTRPHAPGGPGGQAGGAGGGAHPHRGDPGGGPPPPSLLPPPGSRTPPQGQVQGSPEGVVAEVLGRTYRWPPWKRGSGVGMCPWQERAF